MTEQKILTPSEAVRHFKDEVLGYAGIGAAFLAGSLLMLQAKSAPLLAFVLVLIGGASLLMFTTALGKLSEAQRDLAIENLSIRLEKERQQTIQTEGKQ